MYENPKEVLSLARLRFDRTSGPGAFDESAATVFTPGVMGSRNRGVATILDKMCREAIAAAEGDIRDVVRAIPDLVAPSGCSTWFATLAAPSGAPSKKASSAIDIGDLAVHALARISERDSGGFLTGPAALRFPAGEGVSLNPASRMASIAEGVRFLEDRIRVEGLDPYAVFLPLDLRPEADIEVLGETARRFGDPVAPSGLWMILIAIPDGRRATVLAPAGNPSRHLVVPYCGEGPLEDAYLVRQPVKEFDMTSEDESVGFAHYAMERLSIEGDPDRSRPAATLSVREGGPLPATISYAREDETSPMTIEAAVEAVQRGLAEERMVGYAISTPLRLRPGLSRDEMNEIKRTFSTPPGLVFAGVAGWAGERISIAVQPSPDGMQRFNPTSADLERIRRAYVPAA